MSAQFRFRCGGKPAEPIDVFACRQQKCVSLMSDNCTTVYSTKKNQADAYLDDNAVFFGSIMPPA